MFELNKLKLNKIKVDKNLILVVIAAIAIIGTGVLIFSENFNSPEKIVKKDIEYLNTSVLQQGQTATLVSYSQESGVIKISMKIGDQNYTSYATKDGKLFFPEALPIGQDKKAAPTAQNTTTPPAQVTAKTCDSVAKADKPLLEAYVVSRCPYGLQMQRAMSDAIQNIPALADFIKIRYIGDVSGNTITSMHGDAEAQENLRQICIRDEQRSKYWTYVACQMKSGDTASCQTSAGIDGSKLDACVKNPARGLSYAKEDFALGAKYNVTGSPTLFLNGQTVSEFDFGGRSSDAIKTLVSCASTTKPDFASKTLNTTSAATSFSLTYAGSNSGSGNSGATGTNCAPAQ